MKELRNTLITFIKHYSITTTGKQCNDKHAEFYVDMFLNELQERIELHEEIEKQFIENELDDMMGSDDFSPCSETELFRQIQEDERENENTVNIHKKDNRTHDEKIRSWDDGGCSTGLNED
jgi:hypothetical protein